MKVESIKKTLVELERFKAAAAEVLADTNFHTLHHSSSPPSRHMNTQTACNGALRRASMDLTRALAKMRKPQ